VAAGSREARCAVACGTTRTTGDPRSCIALGGGVGGCIGSWSVSQQALRQALLRVVSLLIG
jgi:hypothetical protein